MAKKWINYQIYVGKQRNNIFITDLKLFFLHANQVYGVFYVETLKPANVNESAKRSSPLKIVCS